MTYKALHNTQHEILIPVAAISNNIDFLSDPNKRFIIFADKPTEHEVKFAHEIHICSEEFRKELQRLYGQDKGISIETFLGKWYRSTEGRMDSMRFLHIGVK